MHMKFIYGKVYRGNICKNVKYICVIYNIWMSMKLYVEKHVMNIAQMILIIITYGTEHISLNKRNRSGCLGIINREYNKEVSYHENKTSFLK